MKAWTLCSCLAPRIDNFIKLRRLGGTDYHSQAHLLAYFDRFLLEQKVVQPRITREICERYQISLSGLAPRTQGNRFGVVRQLCQYLARTDPLNYIPEPLPSSSRRRAHCPYIFTCEQVGELLAAASALPPAASTRAYTYRTLLELLYSTGIRIGELLALNIEHFLPHKQCLYIAQGKFRKSRWIVLSASTARALEKYLQRRLGNQPHAPDSPLLLNQRSQRLSYCTVHTTFRRLLQHTGIMHQNRTAPRLHDLRHTFAVHRLLAWYRQGEDVNVHLPALATYMGHVDVTSTRVYLQPTAELFGQVDRRFHNHYLKHLSSKGNRS